MTGCVKRWRGSETLTLSDVASPSLPPTQGLTPSELKRKLLHVAVGGFAFLLRFLTWPQAAMLAAAAFLFNWQVLPRIGGRSLWRGGERARGYPLGILLYPLSVLALVLAFRQNLWKAAAVWGVLAFGDGAASLLGQAMGGPRLPWNRGKGWIGFASFVLFGGLGSAALLVWTQRLAPNATLSANVMGLALALSLLGALVETVPSTLDDNLTVPLVVGVFLALVADVDFAPFFGQEGFWGRVLLGVGVNLVIAAGAFMARAIDISGAASAIVIGATITVGLGPRGLAVMIAFFVIGTLATKLGYRVKAARGIAQEKGGARGWRNAWANGGVPAFLALLAGAWSAPMGGIVSPGGYPALLLTVAYAASVATAAADTCSSEIGKAYGQRTFLITTLKPVAPGTEGAVSLEGTLGGLFGAALVAATGWATGLLPLWPIVTLVALAGLLGSLAESVIGTVAERRGWLDNDLLNALNTGIGAAVAAASVRILDHAWPLLRNSLLVLG
jgi:uncharacterized protein (TIGR00297 family)